MISGKYNTFSFVKQQFTSYVSFKRPPSNIYDIAMLDDLNKLADYLEKDSEVQDVIIQSMHEHIFVVHADMDFFQKMSTQLIQRDQVTLHYLEQTYDRISSLEQNIIVKGEGFVRGNGHEFDIAAICVVRPGTKPFDCQKKWAWAYYLAAAVPHAWQCRCPFFRESAMSYAHPL